MSGKALPSLFRRKRRRAGALEVSGTWYFDVSAGGRLVRVNTGESNFKAAEGYRNRWMEAYRREQEAALDPSYAAAVTPILDHVDAFIEDLRRAKRSQKHVHDYERCLTRSLSAAGCRRLDDLDCERLAAAIEGLERRDKFGTPTWNRHLVALTSFSKWLWRTKRTKEHALRHMGIYRRSDEHPAAEDTRPLSLEELQKILTATATGPVRRRMTGPHRRLAYLLAASTGLRAGELRSLTWADFDLGEAPTVSLCGAYTKNGRRAELPILPRVAAELAAWREAHPEGPPFKLDHHAAEILRDDAIAAGVPTDTPAGHLVFHSLRDSMGTLLTAAGVPDSQLITLMRHADPRTTHKYYVKPRIEDRRASLAALDAILDAPAPAGAGTRAHASA